MPTGTSPAMAFTTRVDGRRHPRRAAGAHGARRRRHRPQRHLREGASRAPSSSTARRASSRATGSRIAAGATSRSSPMPNGFFTSYARDGRFVSYYGDNHPRYAGNVVKAMASAKDGYPHVVALFADELAALDAGRPGGPRSRLAGAVHPARRRAAGPRRTGEPADADDRRGDRPGAGRRAALPARPVLPAAELRAARVRVRTDDHVAALPMEGLALTGAWVDKEKGLLSLIVLEMGVSTRLCACSSRASRWW